MRGSPSEAEPHIFDAPERIRDQDSGPCGTPQQLPMWHEPIPERHPRVTTILKILACWGVGSIALGLWIGPMLRLATADRVGLDGPGAAPEADGVPIVDLAQPSVLLGAIAPSARV